MRVTFLLEQLEVEVDHRDDGNCLENEVHQVVEHHAQQHLTYDQLEMLQSQLINISHHVRRYQTKHKPVYLRPLCLKLTSRALIQSIPHAEVEISGAE